MRFAIIYYSTKQKRLLRNIAGTAEHHEVLIPLSSGNGLHTNIPNPFAMAQRECSEDIRCHHLTQIFSKSLIGFSPILPLHA